MAKYNDTPEWKEKITTAVSSYPTMAQAAKSINVPFTTFKRWSEFYGVYAPNQGSSGVVKGSYKNRIPTEDILKGLHPQYNSNRLRKHLLEEGLKEHKCESCEHTEWLGVPIPLELEHIDGNPTNHMWDNIELLCPNCHALTETYRGRNIGKNK